MFRQILRLLSDEVFYFHIKNMKNYAILFVFLVSIFSVSAQRNIKVILTLHTGSIDANIVSSTVMDPAYYFENVSDNIADSIQVGDTIRFFHPLKGLSGTGTAVDTYFVATKTINKGDVTGITFPSVRLSDIKSLYDLSLNLKGAPFTDNTEYYWYVKFKTISAKIGNIPIAGTTDMSSLSNTRMKVWINKTTSISEPNGDDNVNLYIYPNPCVNQLSFDFKRTETIARVYITDLLGRTVLMNNIVDNATHQSLDVSSLNTGLYALKLVSGARIFVQKFSVLK